MIEVSRQKGDMRVQWWDNDSEQVFLSVARNQFAGFEKLQQLSFDADQCHACKSSGR